MGRVAKGWTIRPRGVSGTYYVRFAHEGRRVEESTGARDPVEAARRAAEIYAAHVTGRRPRGGVSVSPRLPLDELAARWISDLDSTHSERSIGLYMSHLRRHILPHFERLDRVTTGTIAQYIREGLRRVLRTTVRAELKTLRGFLGWCKEQGVTDALPEWPKLPRGALGVRDERRRRGAVEVSAEQVEAFLSALPEWSTGMAGRHERHAVRARFVFAWETGLRPGTIARLSVPEHWSREAPGELVVTADVDKAKYARRLPLTSRAQAALEAYAPESGVIFGAKDCRQYIRAAAAEVGMPRGFSPYDLRHGMATLHVEATGNLVGVGYLLGHRKVTTTAIYVHGSRRAAEDVLRHSGADTGAAMMLEDKNSDEQASEGAGRVNPWERSGPRNAANPESNAPQKTAENGTTEQPSGAVPPDLRGLVRAVRTVGLDFDALEMWEATA